MGMYLNHFLHPFKIQTVSLSACLPRSAASSEADAQTSVWPCQGFEDLHRPVASFRQSNQLVVCYGGCARGRAVSKQRLSHWIVDAIMAAYTNQGLECPLHIRGHSPRAMASSWAWSRGMSIQDICVAAGWSFWEYFRQFYRLDVQSFASQVLSVSGWCMFTTLLLCIPFYYTVVLPVLSADSCICVFYLVILYHARLGHAIQSVQFLMLVCKFALFQRSHVFLSRYANCITFG